MKKVFLLLVILIILTSTSFALEEIHITSGWHEFGETITHNGNEYEIFGSSDTRSGGETDGSIVVKKNNNSRIIIGLGSCDTSPTHEYCFYNKSFSNNKISTPAGGLQVYPALYYNLTEFIYDADVDFTVSVTNLDVNLFDTTTIVITIFNPGDFPLENIHFSSAIPKEFSFVSSNGVTLSNRKITAQKEYLATQESWVFSYTIKARETLSLTTVDFSLDYAVEGEQQTPITTSKIMSVSKPYAITTSNFYEPVKKDSSQSYTFTLTNNADKKMSLYDLEFVVAPNIEVTGVQGLSQKEKNTYSFSSKSLQSQESAQAIINFTTPHLGSFPFSYEGEIAYGADNIPIASTSTLQVQTKGLLCKLLCSDFSPKKQKVSCIATLENKDVHVFSNFSGTIRGPFNTIPVKQTTIKDAARKILFDDTIKLSSEQEDENIIFMGTYQTKEGDVLSCQAQSTLSGEAFDSNNNKLSSSNPSSDSSSQKNSDEDEESKTAVNVEELTFIQRLIYLVKSIF